MSGLKVNETSDWLSTSRCTHHFAKNLKLRIFMKIKKLKKNNIFISCVEWKMKLVIYAKGGQFFLTRLFYLNGKKTIKIVDFQSKSPLLWNLARVIHCNATRCCRPFHPFYDKNLVCFHWVRRDGERMLCRATQCAPPLKVKWEPNQDKCPQCH